MSAEHSPAVRPPDIHAHRILILDFGAQYTQLIARRVRELGVYCEIHPWDMSDADVRAFGARGIILSGGPESVTRRRAAARAAGRVRGGRAGARHLLRHADHGRSSSAAASSPAPCTNSATPRCARRGHCRAAATTSRTASTREGHGLLDVWMSHGDRVDELPPGFEPSAPRRRTRRSPAWPTRRARFYARAVPPRGHAHAAGRAHLERFVREICGCDARWDAGNIIDDAIARVRAQVGGGKVLLGPVGRRGLLGRRGAAAQGDRRPADLRVRRPRPAARRRGRPGHGSVRARTWACGSSA